MEPSNKEVADFYDEFKKKQIKLGINWRHRAIFKKLKQIGLQNNSSVLEIGCGIGTVSHLIIKYCTAGRFVGCDISAESIAYAKQLNPQSRAEFICTDMKGFEHELKADFIVFPDVLEHIPVSDHAELFQTIAKNSKPSTKVLINIPEPNTLDWYREHKPELLQIIDQSLSMNDLMNAVYPAGFKVESIIPYALGTKNNNYLSIVLYRDGKIKNVEEASFLTRFVKSKLVRF